MLAATCDPNVTTDSGIGHHLQKEKMNDWKSSVHVNANFQKRSKIPTHVLKTGSRKVGRGYSTYPPHTARSPGPGCSGRGRYWAFHGEAAG